MSETREKAAAMHEATDIGTKLTKPQLRELIKMADRDYRSHYASTFKPVQRLFELGLVDRQRELRWTAGCTYAITDRGRALLRSLQEKSHG